MLEILTNGDIIQIMRVVGGKYRGKKLKEFTLSSTKPTLDKVKEAIFDMLQFKIYNADVLDLFAGTGALGIEAISRGAKSVNFVDENAEAIEIIKANLQGVDGNYCLTNSDYLQFLLHNKKLYDVVLLDPPYHGGLGVKATNYILANKMLNKGGVLVLETAAEDGVNLMQIFGVQEPDKKPITIPLGGNNYLATKKIYGTVKVYKIELL